MGILSNNYYTVLCAENRNHFSEKCQPFSKITMAFKGDNNLYPNTCPSGYFGKLHSLKGSLLVVYTFIADIQIDQTQILAISHTLDTTNKRTFSHRSTD